MRNIRHEAALIFFFFFEQADTKIRTKILLMKYLLSAYKIQFLVMFLCNLYNVYVYMKTCIYQGLKQCINCCIKRCIDVNKKSRSE